MGDMIQQGVQGANTLKIGAVLWDYDNTLLFTESVALGHACQLLNNWLEGKGVAAENLYDEQGFKSEFVGTTFREIVKKAAEAKGVAVTDEELDQLAVDERTNVIPHLVEHSKEMPDARFALHTLQDASVINAVVSSSHPERLNACMERAGQEQYITEVFSVQDPRGPTDPKPSPAIYLKAASTLQILPSECFAVEDSPTGVKSAASAGIHTIGFVGPYPEEQRVEMRQRLFNAGARWVIESLGRVPTMVALVNAEGAEGMAQLDKIYGPGR
jgi:beta-phosphoglucomutase-like phosphatase (HAD superfamily)